jgi:hypothetical protein
MIFRNAAPVRKPVDTTKATYEPRPVRGPIDVSALGLEAIKRFPKVLAELAK